MLYKCNKCNKAFKNKTDYTRHKNRKRPCATDGICEQRFRCIVCDKSYTTNGSLSRHLKSNPTCALMYTPKNTPKKTEVKFDHTKNSPNHTVTFSAKEQNVKNIPKNREVNSNKISKNTNDINCPYCGRSFTRKESLTRHLKSRCKIKKSQENEKEKIYQMLLAQKMEMENMKNEINLLRTENKKLKAQNVTINNDNSTTNNINNTFNNNMNIQLVAFGQEDKDSMKNSEIFGILRRGFSSVPELVKAVHFNKDRPENHNIYISNMRDNYVMVFDGDKWGLRDRNETIRNIFDDGRNFLIVKYNDMKDKFSDKHRQIVKKFERFDYDIDHNSHKKGQVFNDIKMILYNNREIPINTKNVLDVIE